MVRPGRCGWSVGLRGGSAAAPGVSRAGFVRAGFVRAGFVRAGFVRAGFVRASVGRGGVVRVGAGPANPRAGRVALAVAARGIAAVGMAWLWAAGPGAPAVAAGPASPGFSLPKVDEAFTTGLDDFRRYCDKRQWDAAFKAVSKVLDQPAGGFVAGDDDVLLPARHRLRATLLTLPPEGLNAYRLFFDARAQRLFDRAVAEPAGEITALRDVVDYYFLTASGVAAADRLGDAEFEAGRFAAAAGQWQLILDHAPDAPADAVRLHVKRGLALLRAGQFAAADEVIGRVETGFPGRSVRVGGRGVDAATVLRESRSAAFASAAAAIDPSADPAPVTATTDATATTTETTTTTTTATASADSAAPPVAGVPATAASADAKARRPAGGTEAWRSVFMSDALAEEFRTTMRQTGWGNYMASPDTQVPAAAADRTRVYVNWLGVVFALDLHSGKLLWRTDKFSRFNGQAMNLLQTGLDAAAFSLTAADGRVFVVGTTPALNGGTPSGNTLRCLDAATGKGLWDTRTASGTPGTTGASGATGTVIGRMVAGAFARPAAASDAGAADTGAPAAGGAAKAADTPLSQYTFTGAALVDGPTLYVVAAPAGQSNLELLALDAAKGSKLWSLPLGAAVAGQNFRGQTQLPSVVLRGDGALLYVLTNNGALLCVDTADPALRWALRTEGPATVDRENMIFFGDSTPAPVVEPPGEIVLSGGRVYVKETAARLLYALDPAGPTLLWKRPLGKEQGIAAGPGNRLLSVGASAASVDAATHALLWSTPLAAKTGQMRPVVAGRRLLVQSARGLFVIDTDTGDVLDVLRGTDKAAVGANLLVGGDRLISVSNHAVTAYALADEPAAE